MFAVATNQKSGIKTLEMNWNAAVFEARVEEKELGT